MTFCPVPLAGTPQFFVIGCPATLLAGYLVRALSSRRANPHIRPLSGPKHGLLLNPGPPNNCDQGDTHNRKWLFCLFVIIGEGPCLATYFARGYGDLFALRTLTGISIGGCPPLVYSLMADFFPPSRRSTVNAVFGVAQGVGIGFGQGIASALGQRGDWRLPFVAVALPTLALTAAVAAFVSEPARGAQEDEIRKAAAGSGHAVQYEERLDWAKVRHLFRIRSTQLVFVQGIFGCIPWGG